MSKGKLIVIDGTDGSGKATQTNILVKRLKKKGYKVALADFPQYGQRSATLVEDYLNGKFGSAKEVGPYRSSIFFAVDRYAASFQIRAWLHEGYIVISNRYVTANMGHQGGKIRDAKTRKKFFRWLDKLEFGLFGIPRPDATLILHVPAAIAQTFVDKKRYRQYIGDVKRDLHEADIGHLKAAEKTYYEIAKLLPKTQRIECSDGDRILRPEEIHRKIWTMVKKLI